ncbi:glucose dehydrogenase [FAD, quinone]-like [Bicyclus anynana]|uniref:Glucose dehydrogenase [FAD, quinone]-like n=1 Tax=Bicyclus anynana TaxID=110368 RepID=A0ABM3LMS7_BICAN|nr:glucose dehydrogenase [FAD, quinone]-like [Bicyclus anynana]
MSHDGACATTTGAAPQLFASALNFFAATQCFVPDKNHSFNKVPDLETFDFIIVGAGSAGSVVANRLSEVSHWNVLLLEAGPKPPFETEIPWLYRTLARTRYDWHYVTKNDGVKQKALKNPLAWIRGKVLGGSSSTNAMIYVRGNDHDFQTWVNEGNPSWTPENVNYYFKKAENIQDLKLLRDPGIFNTYGRKGPLVVNTFNSTVRKLTKKILKSYSYIGIEEVLDVNAAEFHGKGFCAISRSTARRGVRESTYTAYLKKAKNRRNLKIITNAFVTKILLNVDAKAYGVEVDINGKRNRFLVKREVIVSGGVVNTPQLLMLSGIGPREHLLSKNISCIVDLPGVGNNLHDHLYVPVPIYGDEPEEEENKAELMFDVVKYLYNKTGYLAHTFLTDAIAFFSRSKDMAYPEFQSYTGIYRKNSTVRQFIDIYKDDVLESIVRYNADKSLYVKILNVLHPYSRGRIYLNTSNPYDYPIIHANYLGDDRDIQDTVDGIKILTKLVNTPYFKSIKAFIPRIHISECNEYKYPSDLYWRCYVTHMIASMSHQVGTSKMGPNPEDAVVNNFLKVHGVTGLRVIDASIMPFVTSGNTNAPAIMIGEMGSDMIKNEYLPK